MSVKGRVKRRNSIVQSRAKIFLPQCAQSDRNWITKSWMIIWKQEEEEEEKN